MSSSVSSAPTPSISMARSLPQGVDELNQMGPMDLFRSQIETGFTESKVDAMKRMSVVAFSIGPEATLSTLVPYLATVAMKQPPHEDELLLTMATEINEIVPSLLKGTQALPLLPILERLASVEETVVRDEAVKAIVHVAPQITDASVLVGMAKRLAGADWFTSKVSACGILPTFFECTKDDELVGVFKELCTDDTPMVRRGAALNLGQFLSHCNQTQLEGLVPVLQQLCKDEQDSVRLLAVASVARVGDVFAANPGFSVDVVVPIIKAGSTDQSWRVRHNLAKCFSDVAVNLGIGGKEDYVKEQTLVMACFVALLQDVEAEVRAAAVGHLARMVHWGGATLFESHLQPLLAALADDVVMEVRSKCALALMDASEGGTLEDTIILTAFGHLLENFLQDEFSEVQLHVLGNLHRISHLLEQMQGVVSSILSMAKATNWRVREGVAKLLPHLAEARGLDFFMQVLLEPAWLALLLDPVANVRNAVVCGMPRLCKVAGPEWVQANIVPQHARIFESSSSSYLIRMTVLNAHVETAKAVESGDLWQEMVHQILVKGLGDKVPNVRMAAAKGLRVICESSENTDYVQSKILPALEQSMEQETDEDCRHFQQLAIEAI